MKVIIAAAGWGGVAAYIAAWGRLAWAAGDASPGPLAGEARDVTEFLGALRRWRWHRRPRPERAPAAPATRRPGAHRRPRRARARAAA